MKITSRNSSDKEKKSSFSPIFPYSLISFIFGFALALIICAAIQGEKNDNNPKTQIVNDSNLTQMYSFDGKTKNPAWVMQIITPGEARESMKNIQFYEDETIPSVIRTQLSDYQNTGYDIAHLLNASEQGIFSTEFPLSTASPQLPEFNRIYWAKMNDYVRELIKKLNTRALIVTGPLFLPKEEVNGKRYVEYQVIGKEIYYPTGDSVENRNINSEVYLIPNKGINENVPLESFRVSLENLEKVSGIIFPTDIKSYLRTSGSPK
jgi:endonuclease G